MKGRPGPDGSAFELLLQWLDADRDKAGEKYEQIRARMIRLLEYRGTPFPGELADIAFDRTCQRLAAGTIDTSKEPAPFIMGMARYLWLEERKKPAAVAVSLDAVKAETNSARDQESRLDRLDECLSRMVPADRQLLIAYYVVDKGQAKADARRRIAEALKISSNNLRARIKRLRDGIAQCVEERE